MKTSIAIAIAVLALALQGCAALAGLTIGQKVAVGVAAGAAGGYALGTRAIGRPVK